MQDNALLAALARGEVPSQVFVMTGSTYVTRQTAGHGFGSLLIDLQHGPATLDGLFDLLNAAGADACPMVRVPACDAATIEKAVELGAHGIVCPSIGAPEDAALLVEACRTGRARRVMAIGQIESVAGFERVEEICAVPGLDAVFVGPSDLSMAYGGPPGIDFGDAAHAGRIQHIVQAAHAAGIPVTVPAMDRAQVDTVLDWGVDWVVLAGDVRWIAQGAQATAALVPAALAARGRDRP